MRCTQRRLANPRSNQALVHLCATLNALAHQYPGTTLTLVYEAPGVAWLGRFAEAARYAAEALRLAEPTDNSSTVGETHVAAGWLHLRKGDWATARTLIEDGIAAFRTGNILSNLPRAVASSARVLARVGETSEALTRRREVRSCSIVRRRPESSPGTENPTIR